jgi:malonate transporter MadL subunit
LGKLFGVKANVGGVGIAMLMLVLIVNYLNKQNKLNKKSQDGLSFWSNMYIPIVVAMASQQNVVAAVKGGPLALLAGVAATVVCVALVPAVAKIGQGNEKFVLNEAEEA